MEMKRQRSYTEGPSDKKLDHFISVLRDSSSQKQTQPIYYPIPMPFPYLMQGQNTMSTIESSPTLRYPPINNSKIIVSRPHKVDPVRQKELKAFRIKKNLNKWRRAVNGVIFISYLKQFCKKVQISRRILFDKFIPKYSQHFKSLTKILR